MSKALAGAFHTFYVLMTQFMNIFSRFNVPNKKTIEDVNKKVT